MAERPKCAWCNRAISPERVMAARSRGEEAKYCSDTHRGNANTAAYRARKRKR